MQKISQERINNIKKHLLDNLTTSEVMAATGESRGTVQRVKKMLKIPATGNTVVTKNGGTEVRFSPNTTLSAVQWKFFPKLLQHEYTGSCVYNIKRKLRYRRIFMCGVSSICKKSVNRDLKKIRYVY